MRLTEEVDGSGQPSNKSRMANRDDSKIEIVGLWGGGWAVDLSNSNTAQK